MTETCDLCGLPLPRRAVRADLDGETLTFCCSGCLLVRRITGQAGDAGVAGGLLLRLGLSIFFSVNAMAFTLPAYFPIVYGLSEAPGSAGYLLVLRLLALLFTLPVLVLLGLPILQQAAVTGEKGSRTVDTLIVTGSAAAFFLSIWNTWHGSPHVYFDTVAMLLVLVTLGRYLEARAKLATGARLTTAMDRIPETSLRLHGNAEATVSTASLVPGDRIRVLPGQILPVDGIIVAGSADIDESGLTGESRPIFRTLGHNVASGTYNLNGVLEVLATHSLDRSTAARVSDLMKAARTERGPFQRLAARSAEIFLPAVFALAAAALLFWTWREGFGTGLLTALSVLVVACPCAFGIAVPAATWIAVGTAARRGVLVSGAATLERLAKLHRLFFDKTGTLTRDHPRLAQVLTDPESCIEPKRLQEMAAGLQRCAPHPVAVAFRKTFDPATTAFPFRNVRFHPGLGIEGRLDIDGATNTLRVGSPRFLSESGCTLSERLAQLAQQARRSGGTVVMTGWGDRVQAVHVFHESLRTEARKVLFELRNLGLDPEILTGDGPVSESTLREIDGIPVRQGLTPLQKLERLRRARAGNRRVGMVGDGINDAPALALADVGIAMGTRNDITRGAASVNIIDPDLNKLTWLVRYARLLHRVIRANLLWAFGYNGIALMLAMAGRLNPLVAALTMILSSCVILLNCRRLLEDKGMNEENEPPQEDQDAEDPLDPVTLSEGQLARDESDTPHGGHRPQAKTQEQEPRLERTLQCNGR